MRRGVVAARHRWRRCSRRRSMDPASKLRRDTSPRLCGAPWPACPLMVSIQGQDGATANSRALVSGTPTSSGTPNATRTAARHALRLVVPHGAHLLDSRGPPSVRIAPWPGCTRDMKVVAANGEVPLKHGPAARPCRRHVLASSVGPIPGPGGMPIPAETQAGGLPVAASDHLRKGARSDEVPSGRRCGTRRCRSRRCGHRAPPGQRPARARSPYRKPDLLPCQS